MNGELEERAVALLAGIEATLRDTAPGSALGADAQKHLLAARSREACEYLRDWISRVWILFEPRNDRLVSDVAQSAEHFSEFLGPALRQVLQRAAKGGPGFDDSLVDRARESVEEAVSREPQLRRGTLYARANDLLRDLRNHVCDVADRLARENEAVDVVQARGLLRRLGPVLVATVLAMAGTSPADALTNLSEWGQEVLDVVTLQALADAAAEQ